MEGTTPHCEEQMLRMGARKLSPECTVEGVVFSPNPGVARHEELSFWTLSLCMFCKQMSQDDLGNE